MSRDGRSLGQGMSPEFVNACVQSFADAVAVMGIAPGAQSDEIVEKWTEFYSGWPGRRVVGFCEPADIAVKLLADSFAVQHVREGVSGIDLKGPFIDLGSGNGWPGLALLETGKVTLMDSRTGACDFMRGFLTYAAVEDAEVVEARAEAAGREPGFFGQFRCAVSRAMASPALSLEMASAFVGESGLVILWTGPAQEKTIEENRDVPELGLSLAGQLPYVLPWGKGRRMLAIYRKSGRIRNGFPRKTTSAKANPLF